MKKFQNKVGPFNGETQADHINYAISVLRVAGLLTEAQTNKIMERMKKLEDEG